MGKDRLWARMGKDMGKEGQGQDKGKDKLGQRRAGTNGAGHQLVWVSPRLGCPDEKGTSTV